MKRSKKIFNCRPGKGELPAPRTVIVDYVSSAVTPGFVGQDALANWTLHRDVYRSCLRRITFELGGRRRHGALDSERNMGRRPSA